MSNLWLKIKIWTKTIVFSLFAIYLLLFVAKNSAEPATFWYFPFKPTLETSMLVLVAVTFIAGVIATLIVRATFSTMRQVRELRERGRLDRLEREQANMKAKAAMLQRSGLSTPVTVVSTPKTLPGIDSE